MRLAEMIGASSASLARQGDAQWVRERIGWATGSRMKDILGWGADGPLKTIDKATGLPKVSDARANYMREILAERLTGLAMEHFVSEDMEHGIEYELEAKLAVEEATGLKLEEVGFQPHPTIEMFGGSADAIVQGHAIGGCEIKCPRTTTFLKWREAGIVPIKHRPQMLAYMSIYGVEEWLFAAYDPRIKNKAGRLFLRRFKPEPGEIEQAEQAVRDFLAELDRAWEQFHS